MLLFLCVFAFFQYDSSVFLTCTLCYQEGIFFGIIYADSRHTLDMISTLSITINDNR